jgi:hypothetical protein
MAIQIDIGILGYCGLRNLSTRILYDVNEDPAILAAHLAEARRCGREFGLWPQPAVTKPGKERDAL